MSGVPVGGKAFRGILMESPGRKRLKLTFGFAARIALSGTP